MVGLGNILKMEVPGGNDPSKKVATAVKESSRVRRMLGKGTETSSKSQE